MGATFCRISADAAPTAVELTKSSVRTGGAAQCRGDPIAG
jgi:hypothetical protein